MWMKNEEFLIWSSEPQVGVEDETLQTHYFMNSEHLFAPDFPEEGSGVRGDLGSVFSDRLRVGITHTFIYFLFICWTVFLKQRARIKTSESEEELTSCENVCGCCLLTETAAGINMRRFQLIKQVCRFQASAPPVGSKRVGTSDKVLFVRTSEAGGRGEDGLLKFKPGIRTGQKEKWLWMRRGVFQNLLIFWEFYPQLSPGFKVDHPKTENMSTEHLCGQ